MTPIWLDVVQRTAHWAAVAAAAVAWGAWLNLSLYTASPGSG